MATERLSMRKTREILRQKWTLERTHREVASSLNVGAGTVLQRRQYRDPPRAGIVTHWEG